MIKDIIVKAEEKIKKTISSAAISGMMDILYLNQIYQL